LTKEDQEKGAVQQPSRRQFSTVKGINRTNDYAFKRILGSEEGKEALLGFLNAVLKSPPGKELTAVEIHSTFGRTKQKYYSLTIWKSTFWN